ncbi:MAG: hypothetical protein ACRCU0_04375 [Candidatus Rhabdochlamydia sp.]
MTSIAKNELHFNLSCYEMAKNNLLLAYKYTIDLSPNFLSRYLPEPASASLELKDKCFNLIVKAPLLSLRAILLCVPIANRITQVALRYLSPRNLDDFVKSSPVHFRPKNEELEIRYSENTRRESIKDHYKNNIEQRKKFYLSDLHLFKNLGFNDKECQVIFTQLSPTLTIDLINSSEFKIDEVKARYSKDTRREFIKKYFENNIEQRKELDLSELHSFRKWGFSAKEIRSIFTKLSPSLSIDFVNSSAFKDDEVSKNTCYKLMKDCFKNKIKRKTTHQLQIVKSDIELSKIELAAIHKLGFTEEDYFDIALPLLGKNWKAICSRDLQEKISTYQKN